MTPQLLILLAGGGLAASFVAVAALRHNGGRWQRLGLLLLAALLLVLTVMLAVPNFVSARVDAARSSCIANLKQIAGAKATWALEFKKAPTDWPTDRDLFGERKYISRKPTCPAGGHYRLGAVDQKPTCSIGGAEHTLD
jgi:hypothetical protein